MATKLENTIINYACIWYDSMTHEMQDGNFTIGGDELNLYNAVKEYLAMTAKDSVSCFS